MLAVATVRCGVSVTDPSTAATRDDDHGGSDDVVLVEVAGDVEVAVDGVRSVAEQPGLPRRRLVEALGEGEAVVAVPAPERRDVKPVIVLHARARRERKPPAMHNAVQELGKRERERERKRLLTSIGGGGSCRGG